ncbi:MAG TPA: type IX secretion system outer membrane channel protein PorV [Bacteroidia bacterium]|jgi:hypothetical protein|nr:type IX secretion system outer membrane channel protein PorV [Bacteroidia bacterium]
MKSFVIQKIVLPSVLITVFGQGIIAQKSANVLGQNLAGNVNVVTTAVPFLLISPDARAGGMGDAGAASAPDANSMHWNPAKYAFIPDSDKMGFAVSYAPWLRQLVPDINLSYLSFYYKLPNHQTIASSLRYFSLGNIEFTDNSGVTIGNFNPNEFALDLAYSRQLSDNFSVGMAGRYIYSNLTGASAVQGEYTHPGQSFAVDISSYYVSKELEVGGKKSTIAAGIDVSNLGAKISYSNSGVSNFLPTNLRLGGALNMNLDKYNKISFILDATKLLVPTPPVYKLDSAGSPVVGANGQPEILAGEDPNVPIVQGMFQSFSDAPGGSVEEFHEIDWSGGIEYTYDNQFAARTGFFYENVTKGGRQYFTMGAGFRLTTLTIDAAYLIPISQQNPLQNTLRISLAFNFGKNKGNKKPDEGSSD